MNDKMLICGISLEKRQQLQELALARFGKANASLMVRHLIDQSLFTPEPVCGNLDLTGELVRVDLGLPKTVVDELEKRSEQRLSTRNFYICSLIYKHLGKEQLQGDQIEVLRRSNYELTKIGTNLNQIAKAFNLLVQAGGGGKLPEIGKKIASLRKDIKGHTDMVLSVLESKTIVWEKRNGKLLKKSGKKNFRVRENA